MSDTTAAQSLPTPPPRRGIVFLSSLVVGAFVLGMVAAGAIGWRKDDYTLFSQMVTVLSNLVVLVFGYWFGSSAGSDKKTDLLAQAAPIGTKPP